MSTEHVVVLIGADIDPNSLLRAGDADPLGGYGGQVTVLAPRRPSEECILPFHHVVAGSSRIDRMAAALGFVALGRVLMRSPLGRLLNSLNPRDQSRVFHRAIRRDAVATDLISSATLLVAADLPAVRTAWSALHSGSVPRALHTLAAAQRDLSEN